MNKNSKSGGFLAPCQHVPGSRFQEQVLGPWRKENPFPPSVPSCVLHCGHRAALSTWSSPVCMIPPARRSKISLGGGVTKTIHIQCSRLKTKFDIFLVDSFREWSLFILGSGQYLQVGGGLESNNILRERNSWPTQCMGKKFCSLPNVTW